MFWFLQYLCNRALKQLTVGAVVVDIVDWGMRTFVLHFADLIFSWWLMRKNFCAFGCHQSIKLSILAIFIAPPPLNCWYSILFTFSLFRNKTINLICFTALRFLQFSWVLFSVSLCFMSVRVQIRPVVVQWHEAKVRNRKKIFSPSLHFAAALQSVAQKFFQA